MELERLFIRWVGLWRLSEELCLVPAPPALLPPGYYFMLHSDPSRNFVCGMIVLHRSVHSRER